MTSNSGLRRQVSLVLLGLVSAAIWAWLLTMLWNSFDQHSAVCRRDPEAMRVTKYSLTASGAYNISSPERRYIAGARRAGSHGCNYTLIYDCAVDEIVYEVGCKPDVFPAESRKEVHPVGWLSEHELLVTYYDLDAEAWLDAVIDVGNGTGLDLW